MPLKNKINKKRYLPLFGGKYLSLFCICSVVFCSCISTKATLYKDFAITRTTNIVFQGDENAKSLEMPKYSAFRLKNHGFSVISYDGIGVSQTNTYNNSTSVRLSASGRYVPEKILIKISSQFNFFAGMRYPFQIIDMSNNQLLVEFRYAGSGGIWNAIDEKFFKDFLTLVEE
jgi:hypothetical protein